VGVAGDGAAADAIWPAFLSGHLQRRGNFRLGICWRRWAHAGFVVHSMGFGRADVRLGGRRCRLLALYHCGDKGYGVGGRGPRASIRAGSMGTEGGLAAWLGGRTSPVLYLVFC